MNLYSERIFAEYYKIIDAYHERWTGEAGGPNTYEVANTSKAAAGGILQSVWNLLDGLARRRFEMLRLK